MGTKTRRSATLMAAALVAIVPVLTACGGGPAPSATQAPTQAPVTQVPLQVEDETAPTPNPYPTATPTLPITTPQPAGDAAGESENQTQLPLIAKVNDQPLYLEQYQKQVAQTEKALAEQGVILEGEQAEVQAAQIRENVLKGLIEQALIEQAAARMQISVSDQELEESLQASVGPDQGSLEQWLIDNDMTMDELRTMQYGQLLANKVIQAISSSMPTVAEQVHARHIYTMDPNKAQAILERLNAGENFAAVAQQESEDLSTGANGGDLGWFPRNAPMMPPGVVNAAFNLEPGQMSGIVQSEAGYHIIRVEARETNRPLTPEMLLFTKQRTFESWLAQEWAQANIERYAAD